MNNDMWIQLVILLVTVIGVGVTLGFMIHNSTKETRLELHRTQDRINRVDTDLRDRIAWIEGMLETSRNDTQQETTLRWRQLADEDSEQEG